MQSQAERIIKAIKHSGLNQRKIALEIGISPQALNKWTKTGNASRESLAKFSKVTGTSLEWLITGEGEERESSLKKDLSLFAQSSPTSQQLAETITELSAKNLLSDEVIAAAHSLILASIPDVNRDTEDADFKPRSGEKISEMMKEKLAHGSVNAKIHISI